MSAATAGRSRGPWPALLYLSRHSLWNRWRGWVGQLRQPRYAIAFLLGLAYFGWLGFGMAHPEHGQSGPGQGLDLIDSFLPLLAAILLGVSWVGSQSHRVLAFTPPEVQFLFQGPITRKTLLDYKLVRAQLKTLLLAVLFTIFFHPLLPLPWPLLAPSLWLVLATAHLHQVAAGLVRTSWTQHGTAGLRRHWLPLTVIVAAAVILLATLASAAAALRHISSGVEFVTVMTTTLARPAPALVLLPFRILIGPLLAPDAGAWAVAMLGTLCLWALHYLWVIRIDAAFEEAAAKAGTELQAMMAAFREGRGFEAMRARNKDRVNAPWFRLKPIGQPGVAIFWKNLTAFTRNLSRTLVTVIILLFIGFRVLLHFAGDTPREAALAAATLPGMMVLMTFVMGSLFLRNDLRTDLQRQELIRTFPLSGLHLVAAEVGASASSLFVVIVFFLTFAAGLLAFPQVQVPHAWMLPTGWALGLVVGAPLCVLAMGIQNGLVVLFPAWSRFGPTQQQGVDQMGTVMLMMLTTLVLLALGLLPPVLVGAIVGLRLYLALGLWTAVPAAVAAWLALLTECVGLVALLGQAYDRMDPSETGLLT